MNDPEDQAIAEANRRFDREHPHFLRPGARIRSTWNANNLARGKLLTDRRIQRYQDAGFYSDELAAARKAYAARKEWFRKL